MVYAYDTPVLVPVMDLYDNLVMAMAISAAKDMYDKGLKQMEDFYTKYGDFMSPFAKDMEWYGLKMGAVRDIVNQAYANGIDLFKSPEGRMLVTQLSHSIDPKDYNMMRANAKVGYAYLDAMLKLRSQGKYSEAQELFDIMKNRGTKFSEFSTIDPNTGAIRSWDRSSPIEATSLLDLTYDYYKNRTARDLTPEDLAAAGIPYDKRYRYSGYLDSDLMNVAPGASLALAGDPRAAFFRDLAEQKVIARGEEPTAEAVEAQFLRDIADANKWALINPEKKADEFALDDYRTANDIYAHRKNAETDYYYKHKDDDNNGDGSTAAGYNMAEDVYVTSLAKAAKIEYLPKNGVTTDQLQLMLARASVQLISDIRHNNGDVLSSLGSFISPEKIAGLIQSDGKNGNGFFLNSAYIRNLHNIGEITTSYKGYQEGLLGSRYTIGTTQESRSKEAEKNKQSSIDAANRMIEANEKNKNQGFRIKVVPTADKNGYNVYNFVGDDNRWHTYALVRVYMSDGKTKTINASKNGDGLNSYDIPAKGKLMVLDVGLQSNEGSAIPDMSLSAREKLGFYGFDATKRKIGTTGNTGWPYGTNVIQK